MTGPVTAGSSSESVVQASEAGEPLGGQLAGWVALGLLTCDGVLLAAFGLVFNPMHVNTVPVPLGAIFTLLVLPWLVLQAGDLDSRAGAAGAPLLAWGVTVGVLALAGPGGDVLLPPSWQSLLLVVAGLGGGLWALRLVLDAPLPEVRDRSIGR